MNKNSDQGLTSSIKNGDLLQTWIESEKSVKLVAVAAKIKELKGLEELSEDVELQIQNASKYYCLKLRQKWEHCQRKRDKFMQVNERWLTLDLPLPVNVLNRASVTDNPSLPGTSKGRPSKNFEECSERTKKRRVHELISQHSTEELKYAAEMTGRYSNSPQKSDKTLTMQQTLALYLDLDLSKRKYALLRSVVNGIHKDCFPSYYKLQLYKAEQLPEIAAVSETIAEVNLQSLLNKTAKSIVEIIKENLSCLPYMSTSFDLICKWGFDGSSGHSNYKQTFVDSESTDSFLFVIAFVPLKLVDTINSTEVWINTRPGSTYFCRPIKLIFQKENSALIASEQSHIEEIIEHLEHFEVNIDGRNINIKYTMLMTMLGGSAINTLSGTNAAQNCYICGAKPSQMNLPSVQDRSPNTDNYRFGLSSLHSWIRCFECLLHISYRLPFKTWQIRGQENKTAFGERKQIIQENFRLKMGLLVDIPKPGYGTSNDGNTARRFFSNPELSSEITGIDKELIRNFGIILRTIATGCEINVERFVKLLEDTKTMYISKYSWYYMPSSVHKLLVHAKDIISFFHLPIGVLSEEALEARHKEIRKARLDHSRKCSRISSMTDLINHLLITSDPLISNIRSKSSHKSKVDPDIEQYLLTNNLEALTLPVNIDLNDIDGTSESDSD